MTLDLSGSTVVATGAFGRLGRILARRLVEAGATVAGLDARAADPFVDSDRLHLYRADLIDEAAVADVFERVRRDLGTPDAVVHTVGMWAGSPFAETALEAWETVLRVNLTSTFLCFREAVRQFRQANKPGRLVAVASQQGAEGGVPEQAAYSASKAGVVRLVEAVAAEHAEAGITAAAVAPSMILFGEEEGDAKGVSAERIADLCAYLASEEGAVHSGTVVRAYGTLR
ncbi:MAG: SDR family NAD(P)-dependent oxidoreductase [Rhodothermales bacterium]|nr:SDR family NAD(P)-dependent oxidoreductase [Rhodothermales bacterium]